MINEFQAYSMQQPTERVRGYLRGGARPALCRSPAFGTTPRRSSVSSPSTPTALSARHGRWRSYSRLQSACPGRRAAVAARRRGGVAPGPRRELQLLTSSRRLLRISRASSAEEAPMDEKTSHRDHAGSAVVSRAQAVSRGGLGARCFAARKYRSSVPPGYSRSWYTAGFRDGPTG